MPSLSSLSDDITTHLICPFLFPSMSPPSAPIARFRATSRAHKAHADAAFFANPAALSASIDGFADVVAAAARRPTTLTECAALCRGLSDMRRLGPTHEERTVRGHGGAINALVLCRGKIVSASSDHTIKVWGTSGDWDCERTLEGHTHWVYALAVLPMLPVCSAGPAPGGGGHRVDDAESSENLPPMLPMLLVSAGGDNTVRVWLPNKDWDCAAVLADHVDAVYCLAVLPPARFGSSSRGRLRIVSGSEDTRIKVWEHQSGPVGRRWWGRNVGGHDAAVTALAVCGDDSTLTMVSGSEDDTVKIWECSDTTFGCLRTLRQGYTAAGAGIDNLYGVVALATCGRLLVVCGGPGGGMDVVDERTHTWGRPRAGGGAGGGAAGGGGGGAGGRLDVSKVAAAVLCGDKFVVGCGEDLIGVWGCDPLLLA
jgi:WD40 repeat protein